MKQQLISIGLPAYNGEKYLEHAINSLRIQTYKHFELILSDDASSDSTENICRKYAKMDRRIRYIRQKRNLGFSRNFNYVLKKAKGKFFMWAGQDDYWHKRFIETLYKLIKTPPKVVLAMSNYQNVHGIKKYFVYKTVRQIENKRVHESLLRFIYSRNLSYFYGLHKTSNLRRIGGYHRDWRPIFKSSDYLTIFKALLHGKMIYTSKVLFFKRDTGYFTNQFAVFENLKVNHKVIKHIVRYFHFPLYYLLDMLYSIKYTLSSSLTLFEKTDVMIAVLIDYLRNNIGFLSTASKGMYFVLKGLKNKMAMVY